MRSNRFRIVAPLVLLVTGLWLLEGCLFIPTFNKLKPGDRNAAADVGEATAHRPLRVGTSTRDDVMRVLGPPAFARPDWSAIAYQWRVTNGIWVWPLCFSAYSQEGKRMLIVEFDSAGMLRSFRVEKQNANFMYNKVSLYQAPPGMKLWQPPAWPANAPLPLPTAPGVAPLPPPPPASAPPPPPPGPTYPTAPAPGDRTR